MQVVLDSVGQQPYALVKEFRAWAQSGILIFANGLGKAGTWPGMDFHQFHVLRDFAHFILFVHLYTTDIGFFANGPGIQVPNTKKREQRDYLEGEGLKATIIPMHAGGKKQWKKVLQMIALLLYLLQSFDGLFGVANPEQAGRLEKGHHGIG